MEIKFNRVGEIAFSDVNQSEMFTVGDKLYVKVGASSYEEIWRGKLLRSECFFNAIEVNALKEPRATFSADSRVIPVVKITIEA